MRIDRPERIVVTATKEEKLAAEHAAVEAGLTLCSFARMAIEFYIRHGSVDKVMEDRKK